MTNQEWMQQRREKEWPWMNDDQFECWCMFCDLKGGANHVFGKVQPSGEQGITICEQTNGGMATFDFNELTRAVVMAHDRCIRFDINPGTGRLLRFYLHKRVREGSGVQRHPTLEEHVAKIRAAS